jgi:branched-chain amino acid transport system ATP-binding protein
VLVARNLEVAYGDLLAVRSASFEVGQGEIVVLIGANGAGKTTTLKTISGLLRPRAGAMEFEGQALERLSNADIVELGLLHVPEGRKIFPHMSVQENLDLGAYSRRARPRRAQTRSEVFELFPVLAERRRQLAGTLSGGEQQMLAIGRALMGRPRLLMLDEPSLGLAPNLVAMMFSIVRQVNQAGVTVLLVEQNVHHSLSLAQRAYVLENGEIVMHGPSAQLMADPRVKQAYLGL